MHREYEMNVRRWQDFEERRGRRLADGREVAPAEGDESKDANGDEIEPEWLVNVREQLSEIEDGIDCKAGAHGRELQFYDSSFPHDWASIGEATAASSIVEWRVARAINIQADLFDAGTDPDDVYQGVLQDGWLLSAISILAASGGVDDEEVDPLVDRLFVNKKTEVGAYGVRLWQNAQWETVVVDDWFPTLDDECVSFVTLDCCSVLLELHSIAFTPHAHARFSLPSRSPSLTSSPAPTGTRQRRAPAPHLRTLRISSSSGCPSSRRRLRSTMGRTLRLSAGMCTTR